MAKKFATQDDIRDIKRKLDTLTRNKTENEQCPKPPPRGSPAHIPNQPAEKPPQKSVYDEIDIIDNHPYEKLTLDRREKDKQMTASLKEMESKHDMHQKQFQMAQKDILEEMKELRQSVAKLQTSNQELQETVKDLSSELKDTIEKIRMSFLETSDHLGQQILQVRRDIQATTVPRPDLSLSRAQNATDSPSQTSKSEKHHKHTFDWEISSVDALVKSQRQVSSHSYHIGHLEYKVLGGADFTKDGRMHVRLYGDSTHPASDQQMKGGRFECTVYVVDRFCKQPNWQLGKVMGDFYKDKVWMIGNVNVSELKNRGYCGHAGIVKLTINIDIVKNMAN